MAEIRAVLSRPSQIRTTLARPSQIQARTIAIGSANALAREQSGSITADVFTGDGVQTVFTLSRPAQSDAYAFVTINGVLQHENSFSVDVTTLTFATAPFADDEIEVRIVSFAGSIVFSDTIPTTAGVVVDEFTKADFRSAKYFMQLAHAGEFYVSEFIVLHDDIDAYITEYGIIETADSLGSITAAVVGDLVQVTVTPTYSNTTVSGQRITLMT
jgi:hypothetical protein